jgi:type I restriction enzyme S subunit
MVTGTSKSHQRVNPQSVLDMEVILPGTELLEVFDTLSGPMLSRVLSNREESRTLAQLRDLLLPKLMSGEIRLHEAEKLVGEGV